MTTRSRVSGSGRLPSSPPTGSRTVEVVKGLTAVVVVLALVVGVPLALYAGFGAPWPDAAPSTDWIYQDFTTRDVLAILVVVVWLAWLQFVICLVVEAVAERRGKGLSPHVPGAGIGTQELARRLVSAVLLLSGGLAASMPMASAAAGDGATPTQVVSQADSRVGHDVGQHRLASVDVRDQVRLAPDTHVQREPARPAGEDQRGFLVDSERGLEKYVEVQPPHGRHYDTLWGIAERYLGDGRRYPEIVALNEGAVQPDGTTLRNPDLIYAGWIMKLPADAKGPGVHVAQPQPTQVTSQHHEREHGEPRGDAHVGTPAEATGPSARMAASSGGGGVDARAVSAGAFAAGGALLATGLLVGLRRKRGWDGGPDPRGGKRLDTEFDLRDTADLASADFIDTVLRGLPKSLPGGAQLPSPSACIVGADGLALTFPAGSRVRLQEPWRADAGGRTWMFRRTDVAGIRVDGRPLCPFPGLVALGETAARVEALIDVESVPGILSLGGDLAMARDVGIAMGVGLATNAWSDSPRVSFIGFADDLTGLAPEAIRHYDDLSDVLTRVDATRRRQQSACAARGYESVIAGRMADPDARLWAPEFIVLSGVPAADDLSRLEALAADPRAAVAAIVVGDVPAAALRLVAAADGKLWCAPLGVDVTAHRLPQGAYRDALTLFDEQRTADRAGSVQVTESPAAPVAGPDLDLETPQPVEIGVLGGVVLGAPGEVDGDRRDLLTEIAVFLALHPQGVHPNVLTAAIWPRGVEDDVRDSALASVAHWLGVDESGTPRLSIDGRGHWLLSRDGVRLDWDAFRALVNAGSADTGGAFARALGLVRGPAFSGTPPHRYGWLVYLPVEADINVAVVAVARRTAALAARRDDGESARAALDAGLRAAPACEPLWRDALRLAARFSSRLELTGVADAMYAAIRRTGSPRGAEAETDALVDELLPGYRRTAA